MTSANWNRISLFCLVVFSGLNSTPNAYAGNDRIVAIKRVSSGQKYQIAHAKPGVRVYIDRRYTLEKLPPALLGKILIQTSNEDDGVTDPNHLQLLLQKPATLYACYDKRATRPASWLIGWHLIDAEVNATDPACRVFRKSFPAGKVVLGGNERATTAAPGNYFVIIVPGKDADKSFKTVKVITEKDITKPLPGGSNSPVDTTKVMPRVPKGFQISLYAREPLIRNPAAMCFDAKGRLFVGQGPQFRNPKPDTPGDSIKILIDSDGDGVADTAKTFAKGFNCIQGLAWKGKDLWVANSPDLTVVRDLDGDDEADVYVLIYTDLGNLEHALHGLNWAPDGKLYMSKGNSRGYNRKDRYAPKAFRELYGVIGPKDVDDLPSPKVLKKGEYKRSYHHPADHWGRDGGVLRCDDMGKNLEIVSRGFRNPWDITFDDGFNFLGTDNDQDEGDRIFMPFYGSHFGWGHPWSYNWTGENHLPTTPISGPVFHGSGTGIVFCNHPAFPREYRNVFFINDWGRSRTYMYRPTWNGALMTEKTNSLTDFAVSQSGSLFRPTDIVVGPDGALYLGGWGRGYGVTWGIVSGRKVQTNEGRVFRIVYGEKPPNRKTGDSPHHRMPISKWTLQQLLDDLGKQALPVWRTNAQEELVRRGGKAKALLKTALSSSSLPKGQETWAAWTLGRTDPVDATIETFFTKCISAKKGVSLNLRIQALRILAHRIRNYGKVKNLPAAVVDALRDPEPRIRFEAVQAIWQARQKHLVRVLEAVAAQEKDRLTYYTAWHGIAELADLKHRKALLKDKRSGVRLAALLGLLETRSLKIDEVWQVAEKDTDPRIQEWALHFAINAIPGGPVNSSREDWSRFRHGFFRRVLERIQKTKNARIRTGLLQLLSRIDYSKEHWDDLYRLYQELKKDGNSNGKDLAFLLRVICNDANALPLLWESLHGKRQVRKAAIASLERISNTDRVRTFLLSQLPKTNLQSQRLGAIEILARMNHENQPWQPTRDLIFTLWREYHKTDDPRVRRDVLLVFLGVNVSRLKSNKKEYGTVVALVKRSAVDPDPRVHSLVPALSKKLGVDVVVRAKRKPATVNNVMTLLKSANPHRGERIFFDARRGNCAGCHRIGGRGTAFAPPLSDIGNRAKVDDILASILRPSAKITEGFHVTLITTKGGKVYNGVIRNESANFIELFLADGRTMEIAKNDIDERLRTKQSIMPANFGELLAKEEIADLAAWLMTQKTPVIRQVKKN